MPSTEPEVRLGRPQDRERWHVCSELCVCPVHRTPLLHSRRWDTHACQDVECVHGSGLELGKVWDTHIEYQRLLAERKRLIAMGVEENELTTPIPPAPRVTERIETIDVGPVEVGQPRRRRLSTVEAPVVVGQQVHYVAYGTPGGEYPCVCRAAIVTEVGYVADLWRVGLAVLNPTGMFFNRDVVHHPGQPVETSINAVTCSNSGTAGQRDYPGGTWHFPERV